MSTITHFFAENGENLVRLIWEHLYISAISVSLGVLFAVPIGIWLTRINDRVADLVISFVSILQSLPSLALLTLMIPLIGVGQVPAIVALFIYSLMPIMRNTYAGIQSVDEGMVDAAKGMGMTTIQLLQKVELPQAAPIIMAGIRLSTTYVIAWTTLASFIGAGGLGDFIFNGLNLYIPELIIGGTIPVTVIALLADFLLSRLEQKVTPINLRESTK
ncbi:choline ABC transporter permease [Dolosigranulum pigrum]|jgi:osmoprotectant transport system permease protein|uniref:ABC transporter permease n=1 Tax=Dolosigranulum pigrum TaxID=29394 RepID=UPI000DBF4ACA|nr:ABC transporter permease [Dolosigranulum pigrum]QTJ36070.1 ABC transporter permease [Dolosigranulum pigrum]QTJ37849.1 ABC transporter permease [Dolosigranulum pigrum]RAN55620.1 choline ABC transporter permease [Dolosigranulum pigrum]VTU54614.1 Putative glycine/betaine/carnitine/choline ABC transporter, membrane-spanning subunit [Lactobacillus sakei subsp.sakei 23K] [Dolosigranulum pigrum]